jgi:hypothetical protein
MMELGGKFGEGIGMSGCGCSARWDWNALNLPRTTHTRGSGVELDVQFGILASIS